MLTEVLRWLVDRRRRGWDQPWAPIP